MPKYTVDWSDKAELIYQELISEILDDWGVEAALKFREKVNRLESGLRENKHLCPKSKLAQLYKCVVSKQTSLVYLIEGKIITIITLVPNRTQNKF